MRESRTVHTDAMVIIDADLQDPPELIPQMAELWRQGYDDVYARRRSREGESWLKKATSRWYYDLLQKVSGVAIQKDTVISACWIANALMH